MRYPMNVVFLVLLAALLFSAAAAKDSVRVYNHNECMTYHKDIRNFWWKNEPSESIHRVTCSQDYETREQLLKHWMEKY